MMRKLQDLLCMFPITCTASCLSTSCRKFVVYEEEQDMNPLLPDRSASLKLKDAIAIAAPPTLAFHLKPKMVVLKVSMHCNGCARKVEKHIAKLEGVTSYQIDLETKMVVVKGDIVPFEVLQSVSKVKFAQLWEP